MDAQQSEPPSSSGKPVVRTTRRRAQHNNSKNGCLTCKRRHVRCDETKPTCLRCQRSNRECLEDRRQTDRPGFRAIKIVSFPEPVVPQPNRLLPQGQNFLEYFCLNTLPMLRRCQPSPVWQAVGHLLRDPSSSLRHVAAAVGYQHLCMDKQQSTSPKLEIALTTHAVGTLRTSIAEARRGDVVEPIFASCFLTMLETLQGSHTKTLIHLEAGIRLGREQMSKESTPEIRDCLRFLEDHARAIVLLESPSEAGQRATAVLAIQSALDQVLDPRFGMQIGDDGMSIIRAVHEQEIRMVSLFLAYHKADTVRQAPPPEVGAHLHRIVLSLRQHSAGLEALVDAQLDRAGDVSRDATQTALYSIAKAKCVLQSIILNLTMNYRQTDWDQHLPRFQAILDMIENALDLLNDSPPTSPSSHSSQSSSSPTTSSSPSAASSTPGSFHAFSLGMGVHDPLMMVAVKCRDPATRRRAVDLFSKCPRREGPWSTRRAQQMCSTVIAYEERRALETTGRVPQTCEDVPEQCRAFVNHIFIKDPTGAGLETSFGVKLYVRNDQSPTGCIEEDLELLEI